MTITKADTLSAGELDDLLAVKARQARRLKRIELASGYGRLVLALLLVGWAVTPTPWNSGTDEIILINASCITAAMILVVTGVRKLGW